MYDGCVAVTIQNSYLSNTGLCNMEAHCLQNWASSIYNIMVCIIQTSVNKWTVPGYALINTILVVAFILQNTSKQDSAKKDLRSVLSAPSINLRRRRMWSCLLVQSVRKSSTRWWYRSGAGISPKVHFLPVRIYIRVHDRWKNDTLIRWMCVEFCETTNV